MEHACRRCADPVAIHICAQSGSEHICASPLGGNAAPGGGVRSGMRRVLLLAAPLALAACTPDVTQRTELPVVAPSGLVVTCGTFDLKLSGTLPATAAGCLVDAARQRQAVTLQVSLN